MRTNNGTGGYERLYGLTAKLILEPSAVTEKNQNKYGTVTASCCGTVDGPPVEVR